MHDREDLRLGTLEEYKILAKHFFSKDPLPIGVYSSYTRLEEDYFGRGPRIETVWGLRDEDTAIMGMIRAGDDYDSLEVQQCWVNDRILKEVTNE